MMRKSVTQLNEELEELNAQKFNLRSSLEVKLGKMIREGLVSQQEILRAREEHGAAQEILDVLIVDLQKEIDILTDAHHE